jgi:hypothetical protein
MAWMPLGTALPFFIYCSLFCVLSKKVEGTLVPRINIENVMKLGFVLE